MNVSKIIPSNQPVKHWFRTESRNENLADENSANYSWLKGTKFECLNVFGPISTNYRIATNVAASHVLQ
jgi:hypothetical protein